MMVGEAVMSKPPVTPDGVTVRVYSFVLIFAPSVAVTVIE